MKAYRGATSAALDDALPYWITTSEPARGPDRALLTSHTGGHYVSNRRGDADSRQQAMAFRFSALMRMKDAIIRL